MERFQHNPKLRKLKAIYLAPKHVIFRLGGSMMHALCRRRIICLRMTTFPQTVIEPTLALCLNGLVVFMISLLEFHVRGRGYTAKKPKESIYIDACIHIYAHVRTHTYLHIRIHPLEPPQVPLWGKPRTSTSLQNRAWVRMPYRASAPSHFRTSPSTTATGPRATQTPMPLKEGRVRRS